MPKGKNRRSAIIRDPLSSKVPVSFVFCLIILSTEKKQYSKQDVSASIQGRTFSNEEGVMKTAVGPLLFPIIPNVGVRSGMIQKRPMLSVRAIVKPLFLSLEL